MRRLWSWLKSWWGIGRVSRQLSAVEDRLRQLRADADDMKAVWTAHWDMIARAEENMVSLTNRAREDHDKSEALVKRYEEELEAARSKITTLEESIDTLVAANSTFKNLWDAVSAEQVRRRVASASVEDVG